jgi:RNA polymerase sigma-70 factor (ECF subfamily)
VREGRPRFAPTDENREKLLAAFEAVMTSGDVAGFAQVLADDAVLYADGGGKRAAVLEPVHGKENILRLFASIAANRRLFGRDQLERASINGLPGFVMHAEDGVQTAAFEVEGNQIVALYIIRNPDKLRHVVS